MYLCFYRRERLLRSFFKYVSFNFFQKPLLTFMFHLVGEKKEIQFRPLLIRRSATATCSVNYHGC